MPASPAHSSETAPPFTHRFLHRVEPAGLAAFLAMEDRLMAAARRHPGFVAETAPAPLGREPHAGRLLYASELSFTTPGAFMGWMDCQERRDLLSAAERGGYRYEGRSDWEGYARWLGEADRAAVPVWKVNLLVLVVLYPTVAVLRVLLRPLPLDAPTGLLLGNVCTVALTGWWLVPWVSRRCQPWLEGTGSQRGDRLTLAAILASLVLMLQLFRALPATSA
ncbi:hypothetical protein [Cyanobium gracile]|uniref:Uncharacterized protein n=1 Tax=Cyanobium gracile UHCC 0281 TaxID=3110309 RepID=A0ABU5SYV4_9CYAN|nr:hypothetical protein [Cyanobium gracile]MEA5443583.1 hypothetical protein [Cyanobium gracile UHCC 0281]